MNEQEVVRTLLGVLQHFAPTGKEQEQATQLLQEAQRKGASPRDQIRLLVDELADGLNYGNWFWLFSKQGRI